MSVFLALIGCLTIAYGIALVKFKSATLLYVVWFALGAALLAAAWALHIGVWDAMSPILKHMVTVVLMALFGVLAVINGFILSQFNASAEPDLDYLIVLGAQIDGKGRPSPVLRYRLDAALAYLRENPRTLCIASGGQGPDEPFPEARCMATYLMRHGIASDRILEESRSTNTVQNALFSLKLIGSRDCRIGIVTNNFHVFRAMCLTRKAGARHVRGIAAYSKLWNLPNNLLREDFAVIKDHLIGNL